MTKFLSLIDSLNNRIGLVFSFLIFFMAATIGWEVLLRYAFDSPTKWAHETTLFLFGGYFILGGAYCLRWGGHVSVDFLYKRLTSRGRAILDLFTWCLFYVFLGVLLWQSAPLAWTSTARLEHSPSPWGPPIWPIKLVVPISAALMLLQGVTKTIRDIRTVITGHYVET